MHLWKDGDLTKHAKLSSGYNEPTVSRIRKEKLNLGKEKYNHTLCFGELAIQATVEVIGLRQKGVPENKDR